MSTRTVRDHTDHIYWYELKEEKPGRWRARGMKRWSGFDGQVQWRSRLFRSEEKARATGEKWLDRLSRKFEDWE